MADLLIWLQDLNWPVSQPMVVLLRKAGPSIVPHLLSILRSEDDEWKYWVIRELLQDIAASSFESLRPELKRIAENPSRGEVETLFPELAQSVMDGRGVTLAD